MAKIAKSVAGAGALDVSAILAAIAANPALAQAVAQANAAPAAPKLRFETPATPTRDTVVAEDGRVTQVLVFGKNPKMGARKLLCAYLYHAQVEAFLRQELGAELDAHIAAVRGSK